MSVYRIGGSINGIFYSFDIWKLAKFMHDEYEEIAKKNGWKTQEACQVEFENLPEENQITMLDLACRVLEHLDIPRNF